MTEQQRLTPRSSHTAGAPETSLSPQTFKYTHQTRGVLAITALLDLDGTSNDETLPEAERVNSIAPAAEAIQHLQARGVPCGVVTGRSFGEALRYAALLNCNGPIVCEDGAVVALPPGVTRASLAQQGVSEAVLGELQEHGGRLVALITKVRRSTLQAVVDETRRRILAEDPQAPELLSTLEVAPLASEPDIFERKRRADAHPAAQAILATIGYDAMEDLVLAADRLATCFVLPHNYHTIGDSGPEDRPREILREVAAAHGLGVFARRNPHLRGLDVDKFRAVQFINSLPQLFTGENVDGVAFLAFGNNDNDAKLLARLGELDGSFGVLVGKPGGGFFVDPSTVTAPHIFLASKPYGHGIKESLGWLATRLAPTGLGLL